METKILEAYCKSDFKPGYGTEQGMLGTSVPNLAIFPDDEKGYVSQVLTNEEVQNEIMNAWGSVATIYSELGVEGFRKASRILAEDRRQSDYPGIVDKLNSVLLKGD